MKGGEALSKVITVDFDGCLCEDAYPDIGKAIPSTIARVLCEKALGTKIILWTCREGMELDAAIEWCRQHKIVFDAINENLPERIEQYGTNPRKIGADEYWDDKAVRVPERW